MIKYIVFEKKKVQEKCKRRQWIKYKCVFENIASGVLGFLLLLFFFFYCGFVFFFPKNRKN